MVYQSIGVIFKKTCISIDTTVRTRWSSWLRHCATSRKVAGSIPDVSIGIFHLLNPSNRATVDSASNRNEYRECFLGIKAAGA